MTDPSRTVGPTILYPFELKVSRNRWKSPLGRTPISPAIAMVQAPSHFPTDKIIVSAAIVRTLLLSRKARKLDLSSLALIKTAKWKCAMATFCDTTAPAVFPAHLPDIYQDPLRCAIRASTTEGSASVEVSPKSANSFTAILRKMRRMTLPERVFGRASAH